MEGISFKSYRVKLKKLKLKRKSQCEKEVEQPMAEIKSNTSKEGA